MLIIFIHFGFESSVEIYWIIKSIKFSQYAIGSETKIFSRK
jgi:hypothetical protein